MSLIYCALGRLKCLLWFCLSVGLCFTSARAEVFNIPPGDVVALIAAINAANANGEDDTINLEAGTYSLTTVDNEIDGQNGLPLITSAITINGAGADHTVIEPAADACCFLIFHIANSGVLTINDLTIANGEGGLLNRGLSILNFSVVRDNSGVGVENTGNLALVSSTVSGNVNADANGGGISNSGSLSLFSSTVSGNLTDGGGGIFMGGGHLSVVNSTVSGNHSLDPNGDSILVRGGTTHVVHSTVSGFDEAISIESQDAKLTLNHALIVGDCRLDNPDTLISFGRNLVGAGSGCPSDGPGDITMNPTEVFTRVLGPLQDNGGPTETHALLAGSPAIDAGEAVCTNADGDPLTSDQRGALRPQDGDGDGITTCDIGAFELQPEDPRSVKVAPSADMHLFSFAIPNAPALPGADHVTIDNDGNIYVVTRSSSTSSIVKLNAAGEEILRFVSQGQAAGGIAVDAMKNIYVADERNDRIQVFTKTGDFVREFGSRGSGPGQFDRSFRVAVDAMKDIYVLDGGNHRVQVFTEMGDFLRQFGSRGSGPGQFESPFGIAVDAMKNIYVADGGNHRIQVFTEAGVFVREFGSQGSGPGQFESPGAIAVDAMNNIYVVDENNSRVQVFTETGAFLREVGAGGGNGPGQFDRPFGIAVDAMNNIYVGDPANGRVQVFTETGDFVRQIGSGGGSPSQFASPGAIAVDAMKNVYVVDEGNHRIQVFTETGDFVREFGSQGSGPGQFGIPSGIAVGAMNNIYVGDPANSRVQVFTEMGDFVREFGSQGNGPGQFNDPIGIAVDAMNNIYVVDEGNHRIQVFTEMGAFVREFGGEGSGPGQFHRPFGIAVDAMNNIYVTDEHNDRIQVFTEAGDFVRQFSSPGGAGPSGIAVDEMKNMYVVNTNVNQIQVFNETGSFMYQFGSPGSGPGQLNGPSGIAVDAMNNIYVSDGGNQRILVFSHVLLEVLDFENLSAGEVISKAYSDGGFGPIQVRGYLSNDCRRNAAVVFDSSCPSGICSGGDQDLGTPNELFKGPGVGAGGELFDSLSGNDTPLGNLLIVHEVCQDLVNRLVEDPDDTEGDSQLVLEFPRPVRVFSYTIMDQEQDERDQVTFYDIQGKPLATLQSPKTGDNGKAVAQTTSDGTGIGGVMRMVFERQGSRGLDDIVFTLESTCEVVATDGKVIEFAANGQEVKLPKDWHKTIDLISTQVGHQLSLYTWFGSTRPFAEVRGRLKLDTNTQVKKVKCEAL